MREQDLKEIDGTKLRTAVAASGKTQMKIAEEAGVSRHRLSHLSRTDVTKRANRSTVEALSYVLGISEDDILADTGGSQCKQQCNATKDEQEILRLYRELSPKEKAELTLELYEKAEQYETSKE